MADNNVIDIFSGSWVPERKYKIFVITDKNAQ